MPITEDIRNHKVFIREMAEALHEGRQQGELTVLRRQMVKRFGPIPDWATDRLAKCTIPELEELSERLLDARNLEELLP